jgi:pyruvate dehydrogenase phosphatase
MESWNLPGGIWTFTAVFDGHLGHETVDHVLQTIPSTIRESLQFVLNSCSSPLLSADIVSKILSDALLNVDNSIRSEFLRLFPDDVDTLRHMTDSQIREVLSGGMDGFNRKLALRCTQGTTAIIALTDPWKNLWIANLGDCQAVLGRRESPGKWSATLINSIHNGGNATEILRIKNEHPGESDCVEDDRVVGFLAPTRGRSRYAGKLDEHLVTLYGLHSSR